jgi:Xaa-Pro aminopeptidase
MCEKLVRETLNSVLSRAGMTPYFNVVLFGSDAANPHGGVDEARELAACEFVLVDVGGYPLPYLANPGAVLHGYSSDITRTFLPLGTHMGDCISKRGNPSLKELWEIVYSAQSAGIQALTTNHTCAEVDLAARKVIEDEGLGEYFGHRLGHGLGNHLTD